MVHIKCWVEHNVVKVKAVRKKAKLSDVQGSSTQLQPLQPLSEANIIVPKMLANGRAALPEYRPGMQDRLAKLRGWDTNKLIMMDNQTWMKVGDCLQVECMYHKHSCASTTLAPCKNRALQSLGNCCQVSHTVVMLLLHLYKLQHAFFDHVHCVMYSPCIDVAICLTNNSICICIQNTT